MNAGNLAREVRNSMWFVIALLAVVIWMYFGPNDLSTAGKIGALVVMGLGVEAFLFFFSKKRDDQARSSSLRSWQSRQHNAERLSPRGGGASGQARRFRQGLRHREYHEPY